MYIRYTSSKESCHLIGSKESRVFFTMPTKMNYAPGIVLFQRDPHTFMCKTFNCATDRIETVLLLRTTIN